ncbi:hypothetical protein DENSPDRAFT_853872 [Dentipellis sp. KUC8613]|nr:hypothetical protein DENSPDRAFT_853872 [Dentipellis sp. KUC8613]
MPPLFCSVTCFLRIPAAPTPEASPKGGAPAKNTDGAERTRACRAGPSHVARLTTSVVHVRPATRGGLFTPTASPHLSNSGAGYLHPPGLRFYPRVAGKDDRALERFRGTSAHATTTRSETQL